MLVHLQTLAGDLPISRIPAHSAQSASDLKQLICRANAELCRGKKLRLLQKVEGEFIELTDDIQNNSPGESSELELNLVIEELSPFVSVRCIMYLQLAEPSIRN
jgi:hypothetical protein